MDLISAVTEADLVAILMEGVKDGTFVPSADELVILERKTRAVGRPGILSIIPYAGVEIIPVMEPHIISHERWNLPA